LATLIGKSILHLIITYIVNYIKVLRDNLLTQLVDTATRGRDKDTPNILDLVIVNNPFVESVNHLAPLGKSDDVVLDIVCNFNINVHGDKHKLNFSKGKYDDLRKSCNIDWSRLIFLILLSTQLMKCGTHLRNISLIILTSIYLG